MRGLQKIKESDDPKEFKLTLELKGRLGNQMFRYAYLRSLVDLRTRAGFHDELVMDLSNYEGRNSEEGWEDSLKYFKVLPYETVNEKSVYKNGSPWQKFLAKTYYGLGRLGAKMGRNVQLSLQRMLKHLLSGAGLHFSLDNETYFNAFKYKDIYIDGSFENSDFFQNVREELLEEFTPKEAELPHNEQLYKIIRERQSVCISIRRGDFVENKEFQGIYDVCDKSYFVRAIELARRLIDHPVFIFFSDDIAWVRDNFTSLVGTASGMTAGLTPETTAGATPDDAPIEAYYESGDDPVWEKLRLMYSCKHFIISNSTFSWWAQYLSTHPDKVVIAPDRWYRDSRPQFLLEDSFVKINTVDPADSAASIGLSAKEESHE